MSRELKFFTIAEVAERLRVSANHVRNLIANRKLRAVDLGLRDRHEWRVSEDDLSKLLDDAHAGVAAR
jgi:excisionase family DNA binding protein